MRASVRHLEVSFRGSVPYAAYYHLSRRRAGASVRTELVEPGMVIDFDAEDRPLGIEITAPSLTTLEAFNELLARLGFAPATAGELDALRAA